MSGISVTLHYTLHVMAKGLRFHTWCAVQKQKAEWIDNITKIG